MHKLLTEFDIKLTAEDVLTGQGIDPNRASTRLFGYARSVIEEAQSLLKPAVIYTVIEISGFEGTKILFPGGYFEGTLPARAMAGADHLYISAFTIGSDLENRVEAIMGENPVSAITLDGAGVAALGKVSKAIEDLISADACNLEQELGMRVQPGQEGWPIEQQRQIFSILPGDEIGIRLTESCLMLPKKSESVVIPRGINMDNSVMPCDFCSKRDRCNWSRKKMTG